jgi:hypothetical protein
MTETAQSLFSVLEKNEKILNFMEDPGPDPDSEDSEAELNIRVNNILDDAGEIISELEKISSRFQNHIKERITAMSDRLSTSSLLTYYIQHRRKIR